MVHSMASPGKRSPGSTSSGAARHPIALALAACVLLPPAAAWASKSGDDALRLELGGSFRTVAALLDNYDEPLLFGEGNGVDGLSASVLRLTARGGAAGVVDFEAHLVQEAVFMTARTRGETAVSTAVAGATARYRALRLSRRWVEEDDVSASLFLDRLACKVPWGRADVTLGRQAVNFSQAWFWNPLDVFLPFDPAAFDRSYKPGVDALRADVALGPFSSFSLVAAAGNKLDLAAGENGLRLAKRDFSDEPWYGSALVARGRSTISHWDVSLQGGKVYGGWQVGGGFSGEAGPLGLRGEATYFFADGGERFRLPDPDSTTGFREAALVADHGTFVIGVDHRFESSLYLGAEYFFNGAGDEDDPAVALARAALGETTNIGEHYLGVVASYEIGPLLSGRLSWIHSFSDGSDLVSPVFTWSVADEAECVFGAVLGRGARPKRDTVTGRLEPGSEFGSSPGRYFSEVIFYF